MIADRSLEMEDICRDRALPTKGVQLQVNEEDGELKVRNEEVDYICLL